MTKEQAMKEGLVYRGWLGVVPVYCSDPRSNEEPCMAARGFFSEIALDIQEGFMVFTEFLRVPWYPNIYITAHADGSLISEQEL